MWSYQAMHVHTVCGDEACRNLKPKHPAHRYQTLWLLNSLPQKKSSLQSFNTKTLYFCLFMSFLNLSIFLFLSCLKIQVNNYNTHLEKLRNQNHCKVNKIIIIYHVSSKERWQNTYPSPLKYKFHKIYIWSF